MEHMVQAVVFPGALKGDDVFDVLHHADGGAVPLLIPADAAQPLLGEVEAHRAGMDLLMGGKEGVGEFLGPLLWLIQHVEGQPLGGFSADARQPLKLLHQPGQRGNVITGHD